VTIPGSSGRPEPRILSGDIELVSIGLDPAGSPYSGRPADAPQAFPERVTCPLCHEVTPMPEGGSDDELELFWGHLRTHTAHPLALIRLWVTAMGDAR
jgi:hypothetical protein